MKVLDNKLILQGEVIVEDFVFFRYGRNAAGTYGVYHSVQSND